MADKANEKNGNIDVILHLGEDVKVFLKGKEGKKIDASFIFNHTGNRKDYSYTTNSISFTVKKGAEPTKFTDPNVESGSVKYEVGEGASISKDIDLSNSDMIVIDRVEFENNSFAISGI